MSLPLREAREAFEIDYLRSQLSRFGGNISRTASFVGMERSALHRKMRALDISFGEKEDEDANRPPARIGVLAGACFCPPLAALFAAMSQGQGNQGSSSAR